MNDYTTAKSNMVELQNDLSDRSMECPSESEDFKDYAELRIKSAQVMNESEKIANQHFIELQKLELEREKLRKENDWTDPKFLIPIIFPISWSAAEMVYKSWFMTNFFKDVEQLELENTITTTPGKWIVRSLSDFFKLK